MHIVESAEYALLSEGEGVAALTVSEDDARYLAILKRYHAVLVAFFIFLAVMQTGALPSTADSASPC